MSSYWLTDPELFLYAKGTGYDDVHLWRCKKTVSSSSSSSLVVPMKPDDFDYVSNVENHLELLGDMFDWDETDYKRLVKYIFDRRLLVNSHGFVIVELHITDKDGNKIIDDATNEEVPTIYIRSLDVLPLKTFIPVLRERPIPLRTVQVLEDVNGKAALMADEDSNVAKLTAKVGDLEAENIRLESKNNALEGQVTKLTADLATQMNASILQDELDRVKNGPKEVWMNDLTNSEWVGVEGLTRKIAGHANFGIYGKLFTTDIGNETNVRATYLYKLTLEVCKGYFKAVSLEDLVPNKEKARFSQKWYYGMLRGKAYAIISQEDCS